jgi:hypothetical protein
MKKYLLDRKQSETRYRLNGSSVPTPERLDIHSQCKLSAPESAPCILMCRLCNVEFCRAACCKEPTVAENCDDLSSSTAAHVAWWLELANTANPQLRSTQIEHGPTTPRGRRIQGGAGRASQYWRSRTCKLAYISIYLVLIIISIGSQRNERSSHDCMLCIE